MEPLEKKTTILFPPGLHAHLQRVAKQRGRSLGDLVREACAEKYRYAAREDKLAAARHLTRLSEPVGRIDDLLDQSVAQPGDLLP